MNIDKYYEAMEMLIAIKNSIKKCGKNTILEGINAESTEFAIDHAINAMEIAIDEYEFPPTCF